MIRPLTIQELYDTLGYEIQRGNGDKFAVMTDDDEGNGLHPVYNGANNMDDWDMVSLRFMHLHGFTSPEFVKEHCIIIS